MHPYSEATQRAGPIADLPELLRELGVDASDVFRGSGIDAATVGHESRIPFNAGLVVLDRAAELSGVRHIGLLLGSRYRVAMHGPIGRLMRHGPTLHQALLDFVTWQQGYSSAATVYLNRVGDEFALGYGVYDRLSPDRRQSYDMAMAFGLSLLQDLTGGKVQPTEILFSLRTPDDVSPYEKLFQVPVRFNQEQTCLVLDGQVMTKVLPQANTAERERALTELRAMLNTVLLQTSPQVRHSIRPLLHRGKPTMRDAAKSLRLHPRTLRRKLAAEHLDFETIRDQVRFTVATELLEMTDIQIGEIATAVAFANHAAFNRAFRRWSGLTPTQYRETRRV